MSDVVNAKAAESKYKAHPVGQFLAQCVDVIDLGEFVKEYPGSDSYIAQECAVVFRTGERNEEIGEFLDVSGRYTVSMGPKSNLRKLLEQWRGQPYTEAQVVDGVPLHKLTGNHGLVAVMHRKSGKGRTYANIMSVVGIPDMLKKSVVAYPDYKRADWWEEQKKANRDAVAKFRGAAGPLLEQQQNSPNFDDYPGDEASEDSDNDSLPF